MTPLRCNHCGAPLGPPEPGTLFVVCGYCKTTTALPAPRPEPVPPPAPPSAPSLWGDNDLRRARRMLGFTFSSVLFVAMLAAVGPVTTALRSGDLVAKLSDKASATLTELPPNLTRGTLAAASGSPRGVTPTETGISIATATATAKRSPGRPSKPAAASASAAAPPSPPKPLLLKVAISGVKVTSGSYEVDVVRAKLGATRGALETCYRTELEGHAPFAGSLDMSFSIDAEGLTRAAGARNPEVPINLLSCVNRTLLRIKYPPPEQRFAKIGFGLRFSFEAPSDS